MEEGNKGKYLVVAVKTGGYESDKDQMSALKRAHNKHPAPARYLMRVVYTAACTMRNSARLDRDHMASLNDRIAIYEALTGGDVSIEPLD